MRCKIIEDVGSSRLFNANVDPISAWQRHVYVSCTGYVLEMLTVFFLALIQKQNAH